MNPLVELHQHGQSFWYDNMRRQFLFDGTLYNLITNDGLRGVTSNPSIFEKAIGDSDDYDGHIAQLVADGKSTDEVYEALVIRDIQIACDMFANLYEESDGGDGYVSLEVSPHLARDTDGTLQDARRLFAAVDRPNLMIKIPATSAGIPAIEQAISDGINVNVTLMFNMDHYEAVAQAYVAGLKTRHANGEDISHVASVASFFISRVDSKIDKMLDDAGNQSLKGKIAIANGKVVYQRYQEIFEGEDFAELAAAGAAPQRVLWASTSTKDPSYPDTLYIDELIGSETVNTMPPNTIDAFRDHGTVAVTLTQEIAEAHAQIEQLEEVGISLKEATEALQDEGVDKFAASFDELMKTLEKKISSYK